MQGLKALRFWLVSVLVVSGCLAARVSRRSDLSQRILAIHSVAILPPSVEVPEVTFTGQQPLTQLAAPQLQRELNADLTQLAQSHGYAVSPVDLSESALWKDPALSSSVSVVQQQFDQEVRNPVEDVRQWKLQRIMSPEVAALAERLQSDALLLVHCTGTHRLEVGIQNGNVINRFIQWIAMGFPTPMPSQPSTILMQIGLVTKDGTLLWYADNLNERAFDVEDGQWRRRIVRQLLATFPRRPQG